jgi:hypothetical protein
MVSGASALLAAFLLLAVRLWFDMAQVRAVVEDERAIRISCARAFKLTFANFRSLFWMYIRLSLLAWLVLAVGLWLWIRVSGPGAIIMFEVVLLIWIATRLWQRASEVVWYQRSVALPVSPALPVAASATESLPFRITQEPITPTE